MDPVAPLRPCLFLIQLYVPGPERASYRKLMERMPSHVGAELVRFELYEDSERDGFFLESYLFQDIAAWSAFREGPDAFLEQRRACLQGLGEERATFLRIL